MDFKADNRGASITAHRSDNVEIDGSVTHQENEKAAPFGWLSIEDPFDHENGDKPRNKFTYFMELGEVENMINVLTTMRCELLAQTEEDAS